MSYSIFYACSKLIRMTSSKADLPLSVFVTALRAVFCARGLALAFAEMRSVPVGGGIATHLQFKRGGKSLFADGVQGRLHQPGRFIDFRFKA
ncbi:hypothetical protein IHE33_11900 [Mycetohabitans endofungorum]